MKNTFLRKVSVNRTPKAQGVTFNSYTLDRTFQGAFEYFMLAKSFFLWLQKIHPKPFPIANLEKVTEISILEEAIREGALVCATLNEILKMIGEQSHEIRGIYEGSNEFKKGENHLKFLKVASTLWPKQVLYEAKEVKANLNKVVTNLCKFAQFLSEKYGQLPEFSSTKSKEHKSPSEEKIAEQSLEYSKETVKKKVEAHRSKQFNSSFILTGTPQRVTQHDRILKLAGKSMLAMPVEYQTTIKKLMEGTANSPQAPQTAQMAPAPQSRTLTTPQKLQQPREVAQKPHTLTTPQRAAQSQATSTSAPKPQPATSLTKPQQDIQSQTSQLASRSLSNSTSSSTASLRSISTTDQGSSKEQNPLLPQIKLPMISSNTISTNNSNNDDDDDWETDPDYVAAPDHVYHPIQEDEISPSEIEIQIPQNLNGYVYDLFQLNIMAGPEGAQSLDEEKLVGSGGFADCYKGDLWETPCAVKILKQRIKTQMLFDQFLQEVRVLSMLRHPNIVLFLGLCVVPQMAIITEFCDLGSLSSMIKRKNPKTNVITFPKQVAENLQHPHVVLDAKFKLKLLKETALGILYLHKMGITHFDVKPDNVLVSSTLTAKVTDFGLALLKNETSQHGIGTAQYMAPELLDNSRELDQSVDIFAFGVSLWEVLTETVPWDGLQQMEIFMKIEEKERLSFPPKFNSEIQQLITECWEEDAKDRPKMEMIVKRLGAIKV